MRSQFPGIAGLAAQIEMFGLSKRDMEKKFTRSELILLAWRSQEISASFEKMTPDAPPKGRKVYMDAQIPEGLPDKFFNEDGEVDLRRVTGAEAYKYLSAMGMKLPVMNR